ncbi:MAG TPA: hypothetical protein V6D19_15730 [Stenomitos sp.]
MTATRLPRPATSDLRRNRWRQGLDALMALVALCNFGLVLFDFSYIRFRDLYLNYLPQLTHLYDPVKGIEPHRDTAQYLQVVDQLQVALKQQGPQGVQTRQLLADLSDRSVALIQEDPFRIANKSGSLEKIKNRMRQHLRIESSKDAFRTFWSAQNLSAGRWRKELTYFNRSIRPLIAANYYRPIDESGDFVDEFWRIDLWFLGILAIDLILRTLWIRQQYRTGWREALLWRWYDLLFFLPFWKLLRIIPVAVRLHQAHLLDLATVRNQINRNLAENIASEVAELVFIQLFSTVQTSIKQGALRQTLSVAASAANTSLADTNGVDELSLISRHLMTAVQAVLPTLQADVAAIVHHGAQQAIAQLPGHSFIHAMPGFAQLSEEISRQVAHQTLQTLSSTLAYTLSDPVGPQLVQQLSQHFLQNLNTELTQQKTLETVEGLLLEWIDDLKLSLVQLGISSSTI